MTINGEAPEIERSNRADAQGPLTYSPYAYLPMVVERLLYVEYVSLQQSRPG